LVKEMVAGDLAIARREAANGKDTAAPTIPPCPATKTALPFSSNDNYHPEYIHVVAALIRRFHEAKVAGISNVMVWGTGTPRREFLYVDDMADACIHLMKTYSSDELVNIGTGEDITIAEFARLVAATVGYSGKISFDPSRPDGTPQKLLDVGRLAKLGWRARTPLEDGIKLAYQAYLNESKS
jgi:GDP-L-fucose synthase